LARVGEGSSVDLANVTVGSSRALVLGHTTDWLKDTLVTSSAVSTSVGGTNGAETGNWCWTVAGVLGITESGVAS